jgi:uncharacterized protein (DUF433 family)
MGYKKMYYFDYAYTGKGTTKVKTKSGTKVKKAPSCKNRFHYITRTAHYKNHKDNIHEKVEYVKSGNMPDFAENRPDLFWQAAHDHERKNARTAASQIIALPKELSVQQRIELSEKIVEKFTSEFNFPYTFAIHNHKGEIGEKDQPHLHIMYCERSVDEHSRTAEQFFSRYNNDKPELGGAKKVTPDVRGKGKTIINEMRVDVEVIINEYLENHAPTKLVKIKGLDVEVPNVVSCLHHEDYNRIHGTNLKPVPMIPKSLLRLDPNLTFADAEKNKAHQQKLAERERAINEVNELREYNNYQLYEHHYLKAKLQLKTRSEVIKTATESPRINALDACKRFNELPETPLTARVIELSDIQDKSTDTIEKYMNAMSKKQHAIIDVLKNEASEEAIQASIIALSNDMKTYETLVDKGYIQDSHQDNILKIDRNFVQNWLDNLATCNSDELADQHKNTEKPQHKPTVEPTPKPRQNNDIKKDIDNSPSPSF